ncbi:hypothetical protein MKEN_01174400 [Mycena kentingensis (nom. inval.)]|nr:hypothetical protein MKEN_01174400 [Mycena kentingensis (nom. inval.)]
MADNAGVEAGAGAGGCCAICFYSIFAPFCDTKAYGSGDSNDVAGCCGSCCNKSFNEDSADQWAKDKGEEGSGASEKQPEPTAQMAVPASAEEKSDTLKESEAAAAPTSTATTL